MAARPWCLISILLTTAACAMEQGIKSHNNWLSQSKSEFPVLVGKRCNEKTCRCRTSDDKAETPQPPESMKRIEIRISANKGRVTLDSPNIGHFEQIGPEEACFYVDLKIGDSHDFHIESQEGEFGRGVTPKVHISEYGPSGPYWYDIIEISCGYGSHACDSSLAREWGRNWLEQRKRGRLDACGSMVVQGLKWGTTGGQAEQNGGMLRDFSADFSIEIKKFATQFPPGSIECKIGH
jgi:hypothetical protein